MNRRDIDSICEAADLLVAETNDVIAMPESQDRNRAAVDTHTKLEKLYAQILGLGHTSIPGPEVIAARGKVVETTRRLLKEVFALPDPDLPPKPNAVGPVVALSNENHAFVESYRRKEGIASFDDALSELLSKIPQPVRADEVLAAFEDYVDDNDIVSPEDADAARELIRRARELGVVE